MTKAAALLLGVFLLIYCGLTLYDWTVPLYRPPLEGEPLRYDLSTEQPAVVVKMLAAWGSDAQRADAKRSATRFPNVRSCLLEDESRLETPDVRLVDWKKLQTDSDAELCIARIASLIGNNDRLRAWLSFHGFASKTLGSLNGKTIIDSTRLITLSQGPVFPTGGLKHWWIRIIAYNQSIILGWTKENILASAGLELTIL